MRKFIFITLIAISLTPSVKAQESRWLLGTGITYCSYLDKPGINLNVTYRLMGNLHIGPDFSAILNDEKNENGKTVIRKELEYNFNAHYLFDIGEKFTVYPLAGGNYSKVTTHPEGEDAYSRWVTAFNSGGGVELNLKPVRIFFETKYVTTLRKYDLTLGILFEL